jgi:hypothetical protein
MISSDQSKKEYNHFIKNVSKRYIDKYCVEIMLSSFEKHDPFLSNAPIKMAEEILAEISYSSWIIARKNEIFFDEKNKPLSKKEAELAMKFEIYAEMSLEMSSTKIKSWRLWFLESSRYVVQDDFDEPLFYNWEDKALIFESSKEALIIRDEINLQRQKLNLKPFLIETRGFDHNNQFVNWFRLPPDMTAEYLGKKQ